MAKNRIIFLVALISYCFDKFFRYLNNRTSGIVKSGGAIILLMIILTLSCATTYNGKTMGEMEKIVQSRDSTEIQKLADTLIQVSRRLSHKDSGKALRLLEEMGENALPSLSKAMTDKDVNLRLHAVLILSLIKDSKVVPILVEALQDETKEEMQFRHSERIWDRSGTRLERDNVSEGINYRHVCIAAIEALGRLGSKAKDSVPALVNYLKDDRTFIISKKREYSLAHGAGRSETKIDERPFRLFVVNTLGKIGPDAKEAIPAFQIMLNDNNHDVREAAGEALRKIQSSK